MTKPKPAVLVTKEEYTNIHAVVNKRLVYTNPMTKRRVVWKKGSKFAINAYKSYGHGKYIIYFAYGPDGHGSAECLGYHKGAVYKRPEADTVEEVALIGANLIVQHATNLDTNDNGKFSLKEAQQFYSRYGITLEEVGPDGEPQKEKAPGGKSPL